MTAPQFPDDVDSWTGGPVVTGHGPTIQPGGGATTHASEAGTGGLMESGRSGATTDASDAGTVDLVESERSGASALCNGWVIIMYLVFVQMTLSSYLQLC